ERHAAPAPCLVAYSDSPARRASRRLLACPGWLRRLCAHALARLADRAAADVGPALIAPRKRPKSASRPGFDGNRWSSHQRACRIRGRGCQVSGSRYLSRTLEMANRVTMAATMMYRLGANRLWVTAIRAVATAGVVPPNSAVPML